MKITFLFNILEENDLKTFFENFFKSKIYTSNECEVFVYAKNNIEKKEYLLDLEKNKKIVTNFEGLTLNASFVDVLKKMTGEVLLLGDNKIKNIDRVFEKEIEKYKEGADVIFVKKKESKIKGFFTKIFHFFYNLFCKIFVEKKDALNITTLGLYGKNVLDVLKSLEEQSLKTKNFDEFLGYNTQEIYITSCKTSQEKVKAWDVILPSLLFVLFLVGICCMVATLILNNIILFGLSILATVLGLITCPIIILKNVYKYRNLL